MENGDRWSLHELARRLEMVSVEVRERYDKLLLGRQIEGAKDNKGRPITISPDERLEILERAKQPTTEELYPGINFKKAEESFAKFGEPSKGSKS